MLHKVTEYFILSLASFCLFSALFRGVAYAQTQPRIEPPISPSPKTQQAQVPASPTPTVLIQPSPTTQQATTQNTTTTAQTTTPAPQQKIETTPTKAPQTSSTPTPTPVASKAKISPTPLPTRALSPTPIPQPVLNGSAADILFGLVNAYRQAKGLPAFIKDDRVCSLANARATEIAGEMAAGTLHSGMYARNLPYWNTENAAAYGSPQANFNWWLSDTIHRQAIESSKTYSCTACSGNYCVQEFTSFQAK